MICTSSLHFQAFPFEHTMYVIEWHLTPWANLLLAALVLPDVSYVSAVLLWEVVSNPLFLNTCVILMCSIYPWSHNYIRSSVYAYKVNQQSQLYSEVSESCSVLFNCARCLHWCWLSARMLYITYVRMYNADSMPFCDTHACHNIHGTSYVASIMWIIHIHRQFSWMSKDML